MASGLFSSHPSPSPLVLLRVAPLISATMAMRFSHDQYFMLNALLAPEHRNRANDIVPSVFRSFFSVGIWDIAVLYGLTVATGVANLVGANQLGSGSSGLGIAAARGWYLAGTVLAVAHMAFVPKIMWSVDALLKDEPKGKGNENLQKWLSVHSIRSWVADVPAWACFVVGTLYSLKAM